MNRAWKRAVLVVSTSLVSSVAGVAQGATVNVTVPGIADIWLAGQPNGTVLNGGFPGSDVAPLNSPVLASSGLSLTAGGVLTIIATGSTDFNGCASPSPDGGGAWGGGAFAAALGVSGYNGPINALIGVFLDASVPSGTNPPTLDFSTPGSLAQPTLSPALRQAFFIGDGRTLTGSGSVQQFIVPAGATRLLLASSDGIGANYNNFGSFSVVVSDGVVAAGTADVPVNSPWALALTMLLLLIAGVYASRRRANASRR